MQSHFIQHSGHIKNKYALIYGKYIFSSIRGSKLLTMLMSSPCIILAKHPLLWSLVEVNIPFAFLPVCCICTFASSNRCTRACSSVYTSIFLKILPLNNILLYCFFLPKCITTFIQLLHTQFAKITMKPLCFLFTTPPSFVLQQTYKYYISAPLPKTVIYLVNSYGRSIAIFQPMDTFGHSASYMSPM